MYEDEDDEDGRTMQARGEGKRKWVRLLAWVSAAVAAIVLGRLLLYRPAFDARKVARAETRMWQAYYTDHEVRLAMELIALLRQQYGLSLVEATDLGNRFARSAMKFRKHRGDYETTALPELTEAYRRIQRASGAPFDPDAVARAELAWWVARRTPGQNSVEQVGGKIAELYALLYGGNKSAFLEAGLLRARAARLRDQGGTHADWNRVQDLLLQSYRLVEKELRGSVRPLPTAGRTGCCPTTGIRSLARPLRVPPR
jgi:hypothetical protein